MAKPGDDRADEMRAFLLERWSREPSGGRALNLPRLRIEEWGVERGMTPDEAAVLFEHLQGSVWFGAYRGHGERDRRWQLAEIHDVR